jgi:hypothetical protein
MFDTVDTKIIIITIVIIVSYTDSACDIFQLRIISDIMNQFDIWLDFLGGESTRCNACAYTGQNNTERRRQTSVP